VDARTTKPLIPVEGSDLQLESELAELAELDEDEAAAFREGPSALDEVVRRLKDALHLIVFFTGSDKETRAWTLRRGETALDAAETIHSDIARGFIRCEVIRWTTSASAGRTRGRRGGGSSVRRGRAMPVKKAPW